MATIRINLSGKGIKVYDGRSIPPNVGAQIGTITNRELYTWIECNPNAQGYCLVKLYTPSGWKEGWAKGSDLSATNANLLAYRQSYGQLTGFGIRFKVLHRQSRIFTGKTKQTAVQAGGFVYTDGKSTAGSDFPERLSIKAYQHSGSSSVVPVVNGWCDTDIDLGHSMYNTVTIDGNWV
ncbi:hypothetical protein [Lederbergia lenta]|uniref:Uncharacterized protein n=1 Tax=Lederbergia lenta TaxID=1467 RepID=A0A2X4WVY3_LEDLE|nr:hypothetical protein [Lederbergia lenta]MEC2323077.1 hypothetical protein [Lederbergia lenta]SQI62642.1 Uncharacterised protein [Lederbergia lenta]